MGQRIDMTGKRIGNLVVIRQAKVRASNAKWICRCDCGKYIIVPGPELRSGKRTSCGCKRVKHRPASYKHGLSHTRLYSEWRAMKTRCYCKSQNSYGRHGGRGIIVCDEWLHDFITFKDWALSHGYIEGLTLDRIDNDGNYTPANCRWVTQKVQSRNKCNTIYVLFRGKKTTLVEAVESLEIPYQKAIYKYRKGQIISNEIKPLEA